MSVKSEGCSSLCLLLGLWSCPTYLGISFLVCLAVDILALFPVDISAVSSLTSGRFPSLLVTVLLISINPFFPAVCPHDGLSWFDDCSISLRDTDGNFSRFLMVYELDFHAGLVIPMLVLIVFTELHTELFPMIHGLPLFFFSMCAWTKISFPLPWVRAGRYTCG